MKFKPTLFVTEQIELLSTRRMTIDDIEQASSFER